MSVLDLTDERRAFVESIREFCAREAGTPEQRFNLTDGYQHIHNADLLTRVAGLGWTGAAIPEAYGGTGGGATDLCLMLEEITYGRLPLNAMGTTMIVAGAYERFGSEDQKRQIFGGILKGAAEAIAMSEPEAGSDVGNIRCRASRTEDGWCVNGQKTWISNAHLADHVLLIARTSRGATKHDGLTMFNVPAGASGMETRPIDTLGGRETNDIFFTDCLVSADAVVGKEGEAWPQLMAGLNMERIIIAALMLGLARRAFDDLLGYVVERRQFGRPIGTFQALSHRIADLATEIEFCRVYVYDVAARIDARPHELLPKEVSMAKLKVSEVAKSVALEGMQMMGGYGYASEYDMERHVRQALVSTIYGGTSEIQRQIIAKTYGL